MKDESRTNLVLFKQFCVDVIREMDAWRDMGGLNNAVLARLALSRALLDETVNKFL